MRNYQLKATYKAIVEAQEAVEKAREALWRARDLATFEGLCIDGTTLHLEAHETVDAAIDAMGNTAESLDTFRADCAHKIIDTMAKAG